MKIKPLTQSDLATAQLRLKEIYSRQRRESGPGGTSTEDLLTEAKITTRLLEAQNRMIINEMERIVRRSNERG